MSLSAVDHVGLNFRVTRFRHILSAVEFVNNLVTNTPKSGHSDLSRMVLAVDEDFFVGVKAAPAIRSRSLQRLMIVVQVVVRWVKVVVVA